MNKSLVIAAAAVATVLGLSACDVRKTQEGSVTAPKYDVTKTQDGNVTVPKYDVTAPDVKVGSKEETVKVPTVKTEERKIAVPTVDVKTGQEKAREQGK
jgi:uncharacterized lipoprotein